MITGPLFLSIAATVVVSLISLIGIFFLAMNESKLKKILLFLVSFAAGSLLSASFFDLLPESIGLSNLAFEYTLIGIIAFLFIEEFLHWHHYHNHIHTKDKICPLTVMNLFGDGIHNFCDGMIIAASFVVSVPLGVITTLSVIFHEIPQEIGDFSILIFSGLKVKRAIFYNFISALAAVAGAVVAILLSTIIPHIIAFLIPFAAGGFIYIAVADLFPELRKEKKIVNSAAQLLSLIFGVLLIWGLSTLLA